MRPFKAFTCSSTNQAASEELGPGKQARPVASSRAAQPQQSSSASERAMEVSSASPDATRRNREATKLAAIMCSLLDAEGSSASNTAAIFVAVQQSFLRQG